MVDNPHSHMLVIASPSNQRRLDASLHIIHDRSTVPVMMIDQQLSVMQARSNLRNIIKSIDSGCSHPMMVMIVGLDALLHGIRRSENIESVYHDLIRLMTIGPAYDIHVVIGQTMNDRGVRQLRRLSCDWDWIISVGRLDPISCEMALGDLSVSSLPIRNTNVILHERSGRRHSSMRIIMDQRMI
jgi:hypothetical protein